MEALMYAFVMPIRGSWNACSYLPVSMRARRSAYECIESGIEGAQAPRRGAGCRRTLPHAAQAICRRQLMW